MHFRLSSLLLSLILLVSSAGSPREHLSPALEPPPQAVDLKLPLLENSVRFAVIGDSGTGKRRQYEVAATLARYHAAYPFDFVLMLGDNLYGRKGPHDYVNKFEKPYRDLLRQGVLFYASLGNHDNREERYYRLFNMGGNRYYEFDKQEVAFFALDSNDMDGEQLAWVEQSLKASRAPWKICFFHHPLYSSGARHGPSLGLRKRLEPMLVEYGVNVVFSGHEHFYQRIRPQRGIYYFISGAAGQLRKGNVRESPITASAFDQDCSFLLVEISGPTLYFQSVSREGVTVDSGRISAP